MNGFAEGILLLIIVSVLGILFLVITLVWLGNILKKYLNK